MTIDVCTNVEWRRIKSVLRGAPQLFLSFQLTKHPTLHPRVSPPIWPGCRDPWLFWSLGILYCTLGCQTGSWTILLEGWQYYQLHHRSSRCFHLVFFSQINHLEEFITETSIPKDQNDQGSRHPGHMGGDTLGCRVGCLVSWRRPSPRRGGGRCCSPKDSLSIKDGLSMKDGLSAKNIPSPNVAVAVKVVFQDFP